MSKTINNTALGRIKRADALRLWIIICFLFMSLSSCKQVTTSYIISKEDSLYKVAHTKADGSVLIPLKVKYAPYTFVIDSNNNFYFYSFLEENREGGGVFDDDEPESIGLMPNHLVIIPKGCEKIFFEENVLFLKSPRLLKPIFFPLLKILLTISLSLT